MCSSALAGGFLSAQSQYLVVRAGERLCGLPLPQIVEVFRPLPLVSAGKAPAFVLGLARVRGQSLPVVDLRLLLGDLPSRASQRYVSLRIAGRGMALAVDGVLGLRVIDGRALEALPPLLEPGCPAVDALAVLDKSLFWFLRMAALLPPQGSE